MTRHPRTSSPWLWGALLAACAACSGPDPVDPPDAGPYVPDPETWGLDKSRVDVQRPAGTGALQVGVATRVIDGPVGVSMAGYGGRSAGRKTHWSDKLKGSAGFYGMQTVKVIAIGVGDERMAFVKSPLMSSESYMTDAIARHLKKTHDLDFEGRVITVAGHSHHTTARYWPLPDLLGHVGADSFDFEVAETNAAIFAQAIAEAWAGREPAEWGHGWVEDWDPDNEVSRDRRSENNPTYGKDPRLTMMAFRRKADATPLAVVFNLPIHGTVFDDKNDMFNEDAPGYLEHKFEEAFFAKTGKPVFGLFAQSAGGDASPAGDRLDHPPLARLERIGLSAAPTLLSLYDSLTWSSQTELAIRSQRIEVVHERIYANQPWANEFIGEAGDPYKWGGWQCFSEGEGSMEGKPKMCVDLGTFLGLLDTEVPHNAPHQVYLTVARLGDLWMMTMPGEPSWSMVKYARDQAALKTWNGKPMDLVVLGYSQDHLLYLTAPDDWYMGGYNTEMSLWGPGGSVFFADESFAMIDAMVAGKNGPPLFEESPSLAPVTEWTPRERERSLAAGEILTQPEASVARTQTARFSANCGDPVLGNPYLRVQRKDGDTFVDIPALHGWKDHYYDNSRYEMVSAYDPDPPPRKESVAERTHTWRFYWQVPSDWPAGTYRLHLECKALRAGTDSTTPETLTMNSTPFTVAMPEDAVLSASVEGSNLSLSLRVQGVEQEVATSENTNVGKWASAGYRLLDPNVRHTESALVRAPLKVEVLDEGGAVVATLDAPFVEQAQGNVATLPVAPPTGDWSVRAWLAGDVVPSKVTTAVVAAP